jgi:glycosyltransferase involved in cell wall biosynthesis
VGFAGSINRSSALNFFLDAAARFNAKNVHFLVLGDGALKSEYKKKYNCETIHFFDPLPQQEVVSFLKDCDILYDGYMKGDIYKYGSSRNKYIEYVSAAKPILVSYSGFPLFVAEYKCGVVVEPESAVAIDAGLSQLLENRESWDSMGQNAIQFSSEVFQLEPQVDNLLAFINA